MNRFELWDKVASCRLQQHFRLLVALCSDRFISLFDEPGPEKRGVAHST